MHVRFTQSEATYFLAVSAQYGRVQIDPQTGKVQGDGDWAESALKEQSVLAFYKRMRKLATKTPNGYRFGPETPDENWALDISLHDEERDGAFFVALALLDPRSKTKAQVSFADEIVWPIVEKIKRLKAVRKELKLDETKPKRYEDDPDPKLAKVEDEEVEESEEVEEKAETVKA